MLSNAEADKVRSELSRIRARIEEIEGEIKKADYEIAQVRDKIGEENDVLCSKGENQAFYSTVSRSIAKLKWELDEHYAARSELIAKSKALRKRRNALHSELEEA
jgi:predicted RNase H-like nuclease (RuvC/YqgF family)